MKKPPERLVHLEKSLGYSFKDPNLLLKALTHKSAEASEHSPFGPHNERLEFLGDAVLSLVTAEFLFNRAEVFSEGDLSRLRAQYVCQEFLFEAAKNLNLPQYILSDNAMRKSGSNHSKAVLADTLEAIFGAVFIDGGLDAARTLILSVLSEPSLKRDLTEKDWKTKLQEDLQGKGKKPPVYHVLEESGPPHAPTFLVGVEIDGHIVAKAQGENKKIASQNAAKEVLTIFVQGG